MASPLVFLVAIIIVTVEASYPCNPCRGERCEVDLKSCTYGTVRLCGQVLCAKGPGMRCGGYMNIRGKCAEGLTCNNCGYCTGCFKDSLDCYKSDLVMCYADRKK